MVNFAFWNAGGRDVADLIVALVEEHAIDILILAEYRRPTEFLLEKLNEQRTPDFHFPFSECQRIKIFTRFSREFLLPVVEDSAISIRLLRLPLRREIILASAHLPSKLHWSNEEQMFVAKDLSEMIRTQEEKAQHRRTVLVGDLNMNPFEIGLVAAPALHGVMSRAIAARGERRIRGKTYPFFYNPMWSHFGDLFGSSPGTFYYQKSTPLNYYWNMFDQVLLRPELAEGFAFEHLVILTKIGTVNLTRKNRLPDKAVGSDHLPIVFRLDF